MGVIGSLGPQGSIQSLDHGTYVDLVATTLPKRASAALKIAILAVKDGHLTFLGVLPAAPIRERLRTFLRNETNKMGNGLCTREAYATDYRIMSFTAGIALPTIDFGARRFWNAPWLGFWKISRGVDLVVIAFGDGYQMTYFPLLGEIRS